VKYWLTLLLMACGLASCIPMPVCQPVCPLEAAAGYGWLPSDNRYAEPLNAWVKNERLEGFLLQVFQQGGMQALKSDFDFECEQREVVPACRLLQLPRELGEAGRAPRGCAV
jgi:hypothetical protein